MKAAEVTPTVSQTQTITKKKKTSLFPFLAELKKDIKTRWFEGAEPTPGWKHFHE